MTDGVDPVTLEVIRNGCEAVAEEMNADLVRTGYSPNIKERQDCSTALFDAEGRMIAQAETMPVHLGAMPFSVAAAVEAFPPAELSPGDSILLNDPFRGGAHLPDLTLVTPIFSRGEAAPAGELLAFAANRAHHADIGGATAGSVGADSTEIYQEGLRIPPVKLEHGVSDTTETTDEPTVESRLDESVVSMILANVRTPAERRGDLRAQTAANATGRRRFHELAATHGERLRPALSAVMEYSERRMRTAIEALPDGTYTFEDALDGDGRGNGPLPIVATVTIDGSDLIVDFTGTADQTPGPVNAVRAVTASATYYAVRCVTDPSIPPNHGCYRPITIETPEASLVDPDPPAAVVGGNLETSQRVTDVVLGALAEATPEAAVAAGQGTMNNVTFGGRDPRSDEPYAFYETEGGGFGARADGDGLDAVHVHMSNTLNTPAEVLETAYPLRVERYALRPDTGGAGQFRGGLGLRRDIRVRDHAATFSLLAERHDSRPYGLAGGRPGASGEAWLVTPAAGDSDAGDTGSETASDAGADEQATSEDRVAREGRRLPAKTTRELPPGALVSVRTPGGGGYGDPAERARRRIARDLRLGTLSPERAREVYGVDPNDIDGVDPNDIDGVGPADIDGVGPADIDGVGPNDIENDDER